MLTANSCEQEQIAHIIKDYIEQYREPRNHIYVEPPPQFLDYWLVFSMSKRVSVRFIVHPNGDINIAHVNRFGSWIQTGVTTLADPDFFQIIKKACRNFGPRTNS